VAVVSVLVVVAAFLVMAWRARWTHDDGFITFRVVDQVFAGNGPVYNAGQRVEAFTSPLHLGLLIVLRALLGWWIDQAWLSALLTMGAAAAGLVAAAQGAGLLARASGAKGRLLPFGLLVPVALPPMWEFATAGLEVGLAIGWVGITFWLLARAAVRRREVVAALEADEDPPTMRLWPVAVVAGLGPLVRPELALTSIALVAALCSFAVVGTEARARTRLVGAALALPLAYELFRMGYYASLVPNTALAKRAGSARWGRGWDYLLNLAAPYALVVPLLAAVLWLVLGRRWSIVRTFGGRDGAVLSLALAGAALAHVLYVVRVGGDYMHGRMLLIPVFALCCPVAVVPLPKASGRARTVAAIGVGAVAVWAALVAVVVRPPLPTGRYGYGISEQRRFYEGLAGRSNPVTLGDYGGSALARVGREAADARASGQDVLITRVGFGKLDWPERAYLARGRGVYLYTDGIGVAGEAAGTGVRVIDLHGLAHPLAARMAPLPFTIAGHEKALPLAWALAEAGLGSGAPGVVDAAAALECGDVADLLEAIDGPITVSGFLRNLSAAPGFTTQSVPTDPAAARAACGDG
jgi:arabinofuranosyltransferase